MTIKDLRSELANGFQDIMFYFNGKAGSICPFSETDFSVGYDGSSIQCNSVDEVMSTKFINGKSLNDIVGKLVFE
ncbi:MAG: hypothetical protein IJT82_03570 [Schwartzia sp.]|nr:hypothetical protein [Schwartzia sp. (in: firmicutes)]